MGYECNIDSKGRAVRLLMGLVMLIVSILLIFFWSMPSHSTLAWLVAGAGVAFSGIGIYEGWAGWCFVRAMGFKTRL